MRLLLDTHTLLWWILNSVNLGQAARTAIADTENQVFVSAVSIYEIAYKRNAGRLEAPEDLLGTVENLGFDFMAFTLSHADLAGRLPMHHRDPFDRILVAQAMNEDLILITADANIHTFDVNVMPTQD